MFRKLVTNLPYSPGLIGQVSFLATRLRREEFTRRLGLIFAGLAVILNINIVVFGPEASVLASPGNDIIAGGIHGKSTGELQMRAIAAMRDNGVTRAVFESYGITEQDIIRSSLQNVNTGDQSYRSVGRQAFGRGAEVAKSYNGVTFYERSLYAAYDYQATNTRALVGYREGKIGREDPWFAILENCGNVVIRGGKAEDVTINKTLHPNQPSQVKPGDTATFRLTIRSNNDNVAAFPVIRDNLPGYVTYESHTPRDMFDVISFNGQTFELKSSQPLYGIGPHQEVVIDIVVRITGDAPNGAQLCNEAGVVTLSDADISRNRPCVTVSTPPPPPPQPSCVALRVIAGGGYEKERTYEAEVNPDGASISSYVFNFGDGTTETVQTSSNKATIKHVFRTGTFTTNVVANTSAGQVGGSGPCATSLNILEEPVVPEPSATCDYLNLVTGSGTDTTRSFEAKASTLNGATITSFIFNFGDNKTATAANTGNNTATTSHSYEKPGTYTASVTAETSVGNVRNRTSCRLKVVVEKETTPPPACPYNADLPKDSPDCVAPQGNPHLVLRKKAENITQKIKDAHNTTAQAGDTIKYSLLTENDGDGRQKDYVIYETLGDVLQYADIIDLNGGSLDEDTQVVSWPAVDIPVGRTITKTITVKIKSPISDAAVSVSDSQTNDLRLDNTYGNNVTIKLPKSTPKKAEEVVTSLPNTGAGTNVTIAILFIGTASFFYFRNRLVSKELQMIKQEYSGDSL